MKPTRNRDRDTVGWAIGPNKQHAWWAMFVELGTEKTSAQPFLRNALRNNQDKALKRIEQYLARSMRRYNNKVRRAGR